MEENIIENNILEKNIINGKHIDTRELARMSPLSLAYLGDAIYESYIREYLIKNSIFLKINDLHRSAIKYVSASSQSKAIKGIEPILTEEEENIFKRGRNHKKNTGSKNASIIDYRHSTGFEALIGYLYLKEDINRLEYIIKKSIDVIENNK
ncbi:Mini-ribonuclease 3 [Peptostreptococcus faecalis]|uniref:Mini-ribonuclease 3 n=1 Tax=Peptostreptococcus faecalis TaxID=2045015 RepID=UPI000C798559|nr:ribonuclease III domain-containing protein [Peptostreptococcus faecalis]